MEIFKSRMSQSKWRRHLCLLLFLLYCFVRNVNPVAQESVTGDVISQDVVVEKVYSADDTHLVITSTPSLATSHHTEAVIIDNIDVSNLIITPAVAPATPWEDAGVPLAAEVVHDEKEKPPNEKQNPVPEHVDDKVPDDQQSIDRDKIMADKNETDRNPDFNQSEPVSNLEMPVIEGGNVKKNVNEDIGHDTINKDKNAGKESELYDIQDDSSSVKENVQSDSPRDVSGDESGEILDGNTEESQIPNEDMPSFKEWSQKFLAQEEEKNKVQQINEKGSAEVNAQSKKKKSDRKQNNFASVDCGAKILEKNVEARNAESILLENKDLYMLNPCSANIWFIVELCDHVHVTSLQLANFEMFSSTTENFQVSFSTRYPTRDWTQLQTFTAKSEKVIQMFTLDPVLAKYMKVEQLSHHGSEHYCPWSLLRVYGNSMVEEYEEQESSHDSENNLDEDESNSSNVSEENISNGILHSATEAVLNFVKETAKKLVNTPTADNSTSANETNLTNTSSTQLGTDTELNSKAIVQLMDPQDFEASCQDGIYEPSSKTCLPKTVCDSTMNTAHTYEIFLEMVRKVCRRNMKIPKICFANMTKIPAVNETIKKTVIHKGSEKDTTQSNEVGSKEMPTVNSSSEQENSQKNENCGKPDIPEKEHNVESEHDLTQNVKFRPRSSVSESSATSVETKEHSSTAVTSSTSVSSGSSASTSSTSHDFEHPSSPTPLPQPPLAMKQPEYLPRQRDSEVPSLKRFSSSSSTQSSTDTETTVTMASCSQSLSNGHVVPQQETTISPETASTVSSGTTAAAKLPPVNIVKDSNSELKGQWKRERSDKNLVSETVKGASEEKPNSHVDILKITLTDEETKEGTAEPEGLDDGNSQDSSEKKEDVNTKNVDHMIIPVGSGNKDDVRSEVVNVDVINNTKQHRVTKNETGEKRFDVNISKDAEIKKIGMAQEQIQKDKGIESGGTLQEKPENDLKNNYLGHAEETCDQREHVTEGQQRKASNKIEVGAESGAEHGPSMAVNIGETNGKKESVFVAMGRKIKALEQNVTMTNLFLEELSQRYRKSLEEMQKKLEKKLAGISKNSKSLMQVNSHQNSTIFLLTSKVEKLEHELNEAKSRLQVINQEVVERHLLGMGLQFLIVFILWFVFGRRRPPSSNIKRTKDTNNGYVAVWKNDVMSDNGHVFENVAEEKVTGSLEELHLPKTPDSVTESKRRRRRRHRSGTADNFLADNPTIDQNIMTKTAGLIFHYPASHGADGPTTKHDKIAHRSCSLNDLGRSSPEKATMRGAASPKMKKSAYRNGGKNAGPRQRLFASEDSKMNSIEDVEEKYLKKSKSLEGNEVPLCSNGLTQSCSLQSVNKPLNNQKSRWIWGLG